jgi:hypothetical protein
MTAWLDYGACAACSTADQIHWHDPCPFSPPPSVAGATGGPVSADRSPKATRGSGGVASTRPTLSTLRELR